MGIAVLGPLSVDGREVSFGRRDRVVLAALATRPGQALSADRLMDAVWGDRPPASAGKVLQGCVVRLRKTVGTDAIETSQRGYRLTIPVDEVDAQRFERLVVRGRELLSLGEPDRAAYLLADALSLWRGAAFVELEGWDAGMLEGGRLDELRLEAEELRVDASLCAGRHREVLADAQSMVKASPLRERRWALLALAQYRAGRQGDALRTIHQVRSLLVEKLGLDPEPELAALEQAILRQDESLIVGGAIPAMSMHCPYQGLTAYDVDDSEGYFGRDADLLACLELLRSRNILVVVGPSGSGKSSLVRAGVAATLRRDRRVVVIAPGRHPLDALTAVAVRGAAPVLVVDQCEEVFSLCQDATEREEFLTALGRHAECGQLVIALRADKLADVPAHPQFARLVERGMHLLGSLAEEQLREAIEGPAHQVGLLLEPGLADLLVREVRGEPGGLPLLSHALLETWRRREGHTLTVEGYRATGGIRAAVAQSAERVYGRIDPAQRHALRDLMLRLVTPNRQGEPVRSRVPVHLLVSDANHEQLVDMLAAARLVTSGDGFVEIAHEALARAWPRLCGWLDDDLEGQRILHHLTDAADAWDSMGRPDSELYRGVRLADVLDWRTSRAARVLTATEQAFLESSQRQGELERRSAEERSREQEQLIGRLEVALAEAKRASNAADARRVGAQALLVDDIDLSMLLAVQGVRLDDAPDTRAHLLAALTRRSQLIGSIHSGPAGALAMSPDGRSLAVSGGNGVRLYETETWTARCARDLPPVAASTSLRKAPIAFSPDGRLLACGMPPLTQQPVRLLNASTLEPAAVQLTGLPRRPSLAVDIAFSADGSALAVSFQHFRGGPEWERFAASVLVWRLRPGGPPAVSFRRDLRERPFCPRVALSPDGGRLYTSMPMAAYDVRRGRRIYAVPGLLGDCLDVSPDGTTLSVSSTGEDPNQAGKDVLLLDAQTGRVQRTFERHSEAVIALRFSHDGTLLASASDDRSAIVWEAATGRVREHMRLGESWPVGLAFSRDDTTLHTVGRGGALRRWDMLGDRRFIARVAEPASFTYGQVMPSRGRYIAYVTEHHGLRFVEVGTGLAGPQASIGDGYAHDAGCWHPGSARLATVAGGVIRVWDPLSSAIMMEARPAGDHVTALSYSRDGSRLVFAELSGLVGMLDAETLEPVGRQVQLSAHASCVCAGPDNRTAIGLVGEANLSDDFHQPAIGWELVDLESGRSIGAGALGFGGTAVALSPDGRHAAVGGANGELLTVDTRVGEAVRPPVAGHVDVVNWLDYSADGSRLVSSNWDGGVSLWDGPTGELLGSATAPRRVPASACFLRDGHTVLIASYDESVYLWDTRIEHAMDFACRVAGRDFTAAEWRDSFGDRRYRETCRGG